MRYLGLVLIILTGCASTPNTDVDPTQVENEPIEYPTTREDQLRTVEDMIMERNRLQRRLYSISRYQYDLPPFLREAIHCTDAIPEPTEIPSGGYLKAVGTIVNKPEHMERLLVDYIKVLLGVIAESNNEITFKRESLHTCYNKFKPDR